MYLQYLNDEQTTTDKAKAASKRKANIVQRKKDTKIEEGDRDKTREKDAEIKQQTSDTCKGTLYCETQTKKPKSQKVMTLKIKSD